MSEFKLTMNKTKLEIQHIFEAYFRRNVKYEASYNGYQFFVSPRVKDFWKWLKNYDIASVYVWENSASVKCYEKDLEEVKKIFTDFLAYLEYMYNSKKEEKIYNIEIEVTEDAL